MRRLELFDDIIFQDAFVMRWEVTNRSKRAWSVNDLQGARVRLQMKMLSFHGINLEMPPLLHNLHMYFGRNSPHILSFTAEQLEKPTVIEEPDSLIKWDFSAVDMDARPLLMSYEFHIDDEVFFNQLRHFV